MSHRILLIDDEDDILEFIRYNLTKAGYEVYTARNGAEGLQQAAAHRPHLILLDMMMPVMDGWSVCKAIRAEAQTPIIMLTAKTQEMDKITGLMMGADDYVTKPFSPSELVARVDAIYRRVAMNSGAAAMPDDVIELGEFRLNLRNRTLTKNNVYIELTQVEFQLMEYFFTNPGAALSRTDILNTVWGGDYYGEEKIVDVNIRRLRMKLEDTPSVPKHLITIWGVGYKWVV